MHLLFVKQLFTDETIQALCWTLVHSLWQGLLLAIVAGIVIVLTKKSSPALRYNLLSGIFFLFIIMAALTFIYQLYFVTIDAKTGTIGSSSVTGQNGSLSSMPVNDIAAITPQKNYIDSFVNYFNTHASLVVTIWFIIFSARSVKILASLGYIQRIRHYKIHAPDGYWKKRIEHLTGKLQMSKQILLLESGIIKVPLVIGFLKPAIMIPLGLLANLPPEQVEAILLHELAHIKRRDYFVNLIQSFAEIIFFFNPAVLWISSLIRDERENCCDDIAVAHTDNKTNYIRALVSFQEYNLTAPRYATALSGGKNHLLDRVKRIVFNNNKTLNTVEKIFLVCCFIITGSLTFVFSQSPKNGTLQKVVSNTGKNTSSTGLNKYYEPNEPTEMNTKSRADEIPAKQNLTDLIGDTLPVTKENDGIITDSSIIIYNENGFKVVTKNNKVIRLYFKGKRIPDEKINDYSRLTDKIINHANENEDEKWALKDADQARLDEIQAMNDKEQADRDKLRLLLDAKQAEENIARDKLDPAMRKKMEELNEQTIKMQKLAEKNALRNKMNPDERKKTEELFDQQLQVLGLIEKMKFLDQQKLDYEQSLIEKMKMPDQNRFNQENIIELQKKLSMQNLEDEKLDALKLSMEDDVLRKKFTAEAAGKMQDFVTPVIDDLINEKIITDRETLSFTLDKNVLIVNGVKQPASLHDRLKQKYITNPANKIIYSKKNGSTSTTVNNYK